jgi:hypothetical protein
MKRLVLLSILVAVLGLSAGCTPETTGDIVDDLTKIPFVKRTEQEVNDWFNGHDLIIIDDTTMNVPGVINGTPTILLLESYEVDNVFYHDALCITQYNKLPGEPLPAKYAAIVSIKELDNPDLFAVNEVKLTSCNDNDPPELRFLAPNVAFGRPYSVIEQAFRDATDHWLKHDVVAMLKSNTNMTGLEVNSTPRSPAKNRGVSHAVIESESSPGSWAIAFTAE